MSNNSGIYIVVDGKLRLISSSAITVNNISPDKDKNITLTKDDIGLDKVGNYSIASTVDAQNGVSDEKYMTPKSTKVAIKYNLQNIEDKVDSHLKDKNNPHNVTAEQIGAVTSVNGIEQVDGNVDLGNLVKSVNSKAADDEGNVDLGELATPTDVSNSKIEAVTEAKNYTDSKIDSLEFDGVKSVNNKLPDEEGNVDLGELVYSVAGIAPDAVGDVPLTIGDLTTDGYLPPTAPPREYPLGITSFRTNASMSKEWQELVGDGIVNTRTLVVTHKADNTWQATQTIYLIDGYANTGNTIQHRAMYVRSAMASTQSEKNQWSDPVKVLSSHDLSDSTTSDSSDKVATSKAVYKLQQEISELRNAIIELGGKI